MTPRRHVLIVGGAGFIGSWVAGALRAAGVEVTTADIVRGSDVTLDVRDLTRVRECFRLVRPTHVLNLAGELELSAAPHHYGATIVGSRNVGSVAMDHDAVRVVHTSTQNVCRTPAGPKHDFDFQPDSDYATSKVWSEYAVRSSCDRVVIARPTNIWGAGNMVLRQGLWKQMAEGRFAYPSGVETKRSYGFVANAALQFVWLLFSDDVDVQSVYYVGDPPIDQGDWLEAFSEALSGKPLRRVPVSLLRLGAEVGEVGRGFGLTVPLYRSRFRGMVVDQLIPLDRIAGFAGTPVDLATGVALVTEAIRVGSRDNDATDFFESLAQRGLLDHSLI